MKKNTHTETVLAIGPRVIAAAIALAIAGCASGLPGNQGTAIEEKQYVTGSNIPRDANKSGVKTVSAEEAALSRATVQMPPKGKSGG